LHRINNTQNLQSIINTICREQSYTGIYILCDPATSFILDEKLTVEQLPTKHLLLKSCEFIVDLIIYLSLCVCMCVNTLGTPRTYL
jgi:hypothetical protein